MDNLTWLQDLVYTDLFIVGVGAAFKKKWLTICCISLCNFSVTLF